MAMTTITENVTLDLREIVPAARQEFKSRIFSAFESLGVGNTLTIINDHDPIPLYNQFCAEYEGEFEWVYGEKGPVDWKIDITRIKEGKIVPLEARIEKALESVRPYLRADGGDVEFVGLGDDNVVTVRLTGACHGCPSSQMTLQMGVERILKDKVPEVARVEAI